MRFARPRPRARMRETTVPMINVVFLLLIFFLMTAQITPPAPFEVTLPTADGGATAEPGDTLYLGPDGTLGFGVLRGDAALAAAAQVPDLMIRADSGVAAHRLAATLTALAASGNPAQQVYLITQARRP